MITVDSGELGSALRMFGKIAKKETKEQAVLIAKAQTLELCVGGMTTEIAAAGAWLGEARVSARHLLLLPESLPPEGKVEIRVDAERRKLYLAGVGISCQWQPAGGKAIQLPLRAPFLLVARVGLDETDEDIARSGLEKVVGHARERIDRLVARAARALAPLGVTAKDLEPIVAQGIRRETDAMYPLPKG